MANDCLYEMKIRGSKKAITRVVKCLNTYYDYDEGKPKHRHFFRVFECVNEDEFVDNKDGTFTKYVFGYCAWSVNSAMIDKGKHSYYHYLKEEFHDIFMGTTLAEQSRDCVIEVFSEEEGCGFSEHYIFDHGTCECDNCVEISPVGYDSNGNITHDIDWETYDGDWDIENPNRVAIGETFAWTI